MTICGVPIRLRGQVLKCELAPGHPEPHFAAHDLRCPSASIFLENCIMGLGHEGRHSDGTHVWGYPPTPTSPAKEPRPHTRPRRDPETSTTTITVQRACNRCGRGLGDATEKELDACVNGRPLPDVHGECGCTSSTSTPADTAEEETKAEAVEAAITAWVETAYQTTFAGLGHSDTELAAKKAIGEMRHLHLAEPWLLAKRITDILAGDTAPGAAPVVPSPTETGPWPTWQQVPEGLKYVSQAHQAGNRYVNRDGVRMSSLGAEEYPSVVSDAQVQYLAPFIAAEAAQ